MPSAGDRMRAPVQRGVRASRAVKRNGQSAVQGLLGPRKCHCSKGLGDGCQSVAQGAGPRCRSCRARKTCKTEQATDPTAGKRAIPTP